MKKLTLIIVIIFIANTFFAQDIIEKRDNSVVKAKISTVKKCIIKYKKANYIDGPTFQMPRYKINKIIYANGDTTVYKHLNVKISKELSNRKGFSLGVNYAAGASNVLKSTTYPNFGYNTGLDIKYYFNNKFGVKTGVQYHGIEFYHEFMNENNNGDNNNENDNLDEENNDLNNEIENETEDIDFSDGLINAGIGIPFHIIYTSDKRLGLNFEIGGTYFFPFNTDVEPVKIDLKNNYVLTAESVIGFNYRFSPRMSFNAGAFVQYDLVNYTNISNDPNIFGGLQFGIDYNFGE